LGTVYAVAFKGDRFLMVFNKKRNGWEMPGGHVEDGESVEVAAKREFSEEAGYEIDILETKDIGQCHVCACLLLDRINDSPEMISDLFSAIPYDLAFDRDEYETVISWARSSVSRSGKDRHLQ